MAEFRSKYPYSYLSESNMRQEADEFLDQLKNFDSLEGVFDLAKYGGRSDRLHHSMRTDQKRIFTTPFRA